MSVTVAPGVTFSHSAELGATGLVGTAGVQILNSANAVVMARTTAGISEAPAGSGLYFKSLVAPVTYGHYIIVWDTGTISPDTVAFDDLFVTSTLSAPPASGPNANVPTAEELRADTRIDWVGLGLPIPADPLVPDPLSAEIAIAEAYVEEKTGRDVETLSPTSNLGIIAKRAITLRVIQQAVQGRGSFITHEIDRQIISFAVPGYSETRASGSSTTGKGYPAGLFNDWPILNDLLWVLATQEKRDEALALFYGEQPPASAIVAVGWTDRRPNRMPLLGEDPFFYG